MATPIMTAVSALVLPIRFLPDAGSADYLAIATAALNRGFKVTPVHPLEKRGVLYNWNRNPTTTLSEVIQQFGSLGPCNSRATASESHSKRRTYVDMMVIETVGQTGRTLKYPNSPSFVHCTPRRWRGA